MVEPELTGCPDKKPDHRMVKMGEVVGVHGVQGWIKILSWARPRESIFDFSDWWLEVGSEVRRYRLRSGKTQGKGLIAQLGGLDDRENARQLIKAKISVLFSDLPKLPQGEYYWDQLLGMRVTTLDGVALGEVSALMETGANDVLIVSGERERLVPYIPDVVKRVDLEGATIAVDWDPEF